MTNSRWSTCLSVALGVLSYGLIASPAPAPVISNYFYVEPAPRGNASNDGSEFSPLDLATALSAASPAGPGDTIWLRDGTYHGTFASYLTGIEGAEVTVRQYPGERAIIDSNPSAEDALTVRGAWTKYWGFEVMSSEPTRAFAAGGTPANLTRGAGVTAYGHHVILINLVVHDMGTSGLGIWTPATDTEAYGNVIYNNGWMGPDRGHGHGIYTQNRYGIRRLTDNVVLNQFSHGIHAYGSNTAFIDNIQLEGNMVFNSGFFATATAERNILIGGEAQAVAANPVAIRNYTYFNPSLVYGKPNTFGYIGGCSNLSMRENYIAHLARDTFSLSNCDGDVRENVVIGWVDPSYPPRYPSNTYSAVRPTANRVFVRKNRYEPGRSNIAVYNWQNLPSVSVDLAGTDLTPGTPFEIRDAQNFVGPPVASGVYAGTPVTIPMTSTATSQAVGNAPAPPQLHTTSEFGVFIVLPGSAPLLPIPTVTFTAEPASIEAGASAVLTWSVAGATTVMIDQGVGSVALTGSFWLAPTETTLYTLTATSAAGATSVARATITVTQPNVLPTVSMTTSAGPFVSPATVQLTAVAADADGTIVKVEFFRGATLIGSDTSEPYGFQWLNVAAGTYELTARAADNRGGQVFAAPLTVVVLAPNVLPTVTLTASAGPFIAPATINLVANATDADGTIAKVIFYKSGSAIGEDTTSPYAFEWTGVASGTHSLTARAIDNRGGERLSAAVSLVVLTPNVLPVVTLSLPVGPFVGPATAPLSATALDPDGTITKVAFFNGATRLVEDYGAPYSFTWTNIPVGTYELTARATDNRGGVTTSAPVTLVVTTNVPPSVSVVVPPGPFTAPAMIDLAAFASDSDGTVARVAFYQGATRIGEDTTSPYTLRWSNAPAGTHQITARAYDNRNLVGISAPATVVIAPVNILPTVSLTVPGGSFIALATLNLNATASDSDGIARVVFYLGATPLGEDTSAPYALQLTNVAAGSHQFTARAYDNRGGEKISGQVTVVVAPRANLSITLTTLPGAFMAGQPFTYSIVVTNHGPSPATAVRITERLPAGLVRNSHVVSQGTCIWAYAVCDLGTLASGATASLSVTVTPTAAGNFTNPVSVASPVVDPILSDNSATLVTAVGPKGDLGVAASTSASPAIVGQTPHLHRGGDQRRTR